MIESWYHFRSDVKEGKAKGPPCSDCIFWLPVVKQMFSKGKMIEDGITACHTDDMYHDFSCFKVKE